MTDDTASALGNLEQAVSVVRSSIFLPVGTPSLLPSCRVAHSISIVFACKTVMMFAGLVFLRMLGNRGVDFYRF